MPIDIQIKGRQIKDGAVDASKMDLTDTFDFTSGTVQVAAPVAGSDAATKAYVDAQLPDGFSGGDGIDINTSGDPDVISVDLATNPGLQFTTGKLDMKLADQSLTKDAAGVKAKLKAETGGSLSVDVDGLFIADGAIGNAKLANSTISGKALGANLDSLQAAASGAIQLTSYNGSSAVSDLAVKVDNANIQINASNQLEVGIIGPSQVALKQVMDKFSGTGSAASFDLTEPLLTNFLEPMVFVNGLLMEKVASSPSGKSEYTVSATGGSGGVGQITFGTAPDSGDIIRVNYLAEITGP